MTDYEDDVSLPTSGPSTKLLGVGIAAGVVPFFFHMTTVRTVNGEVTSYLDYVGVAGGGLALLIGAFGLIGALRAGGPSRNKLLGMAAAALLLGGYQLARGVGVFA